MEGKRPRPGFLEGIFTRQERMALLFFIGVSFPGMVLMAWSRGRIPWMDPIQVNRVRLEVRVNSASAAELASLPGIGPALAQRIVEERRAHGYFLTPADLKRVKGVSRKTLEKLEGLVRFD